MANTLTEAIPQLLAQGLVCLRENAIMPRLVNSQYSLMAAEQGDTITIPVPSAITAKAVSPAVTPATTGNVVPTKVSISLDQWYEAPFHMTDKDLLEVQTGYLPKQAQEAIKALSNNVDNALLGLYTGIYGFAGTAGTDPFASSTAEATEARKVLNNQLAPLDNRRFVFNADAEANALGLRAFTDMSFSGDMQAIVEGNLNRKLGFDFFLDQNIPEHTCGARTGSIVTAATQTVGTGTITWSGGTGNTAIGDQFTVAGDTQVYVCTNATDSGSGVQSFTPTAKVAWAASAVATFKGTASTAYAQNLAFHRDCLAFASRPLMDIGDGLGNQIYAAGDPISGIALRLEVSREHKRTRFSYDILYGVEMVRADLGTRIWGA